MKTLTFIVACFFSITCFGQTKLISFRSHSGTNANFRTAVEHNMFDIGNSNFGLAISYIDKIDTVILKANKVIVMRKRYRLIQGRINKTTFIKDTLTKTKEAVFFAINNVDSLRADVQKKYPNAKLDSTQFIGFDKQFKQTKASNKQPKKR